MRTEITLGNPEDSTRSNFESLCNELNLRWFSYKEDAGHGKSQAAAQKQRVVYFIHENGLTTGVKFVYKHEMSDQVLAFSVHRMSPRHHDASFVAWAGRQGMRLQTTMSEASRREVQRQKAMLEAMKEASAAGEMTAVEAGVAPVAVAL